MMENMVKVLHYIFKYMIEQKITYDNIARQVPHMEQELLTLLGEHLSSPLVFSGFFLLDS